MFAFMDIFSYNQILFTIKVNSFYWNDNEFQFGKRLQFLNVRQSNMFTIDNFMIDFFRYGKDKKAVYNSSIIHSSIVVKFHLFYDVAPLKLVI